MVVVANQAGDANFSWAPGLASSFYGSLDIHCGTTFIDSYWYSGQYVKGQNYSHMSGKWGISVLQMSLVYIG